MKTHKILLLLIGLSMIGCSDLEEKPVGLLAPEGFFKSTDDIQTAVNASYAHMINEKFWGRKLSIALMLRSDMVALTPASAGNSRRKEMDDVSGLDNNGMISEFWPKTYQGIAAANGAIAGAELVNATDAEKNPVIAQAYFARAFFYFHLVRQFGAVPYITETVSAANADAIATVSRTPAAEVYEGIISDLEFAKLHLPNTQPARSIPAKSAASSYLALVYLTMGDFQKAWAESKEVIDNAGTYNLALDSDFQTLFDADKIDSSIEPIFALDYNNVEAPNNAYDQIAPMTGIRGNSRHGNSNSGWSQAIPSLGVYLDWDSNDYRRAVSLTDEAIFDEDGPFYDYTQFGTAPGSTHSAAVARPYISKYYRFPGNFARGSVRATSHNYSMMRYAEVLLIAAEAAVELGDNASATTYINMVRARARSGGSWKSTSASASPADISGTVTVNDVLEERRLELAFECKRWYDIARRQLGTMVYSPSGFEGEKPGFSSNNYLLPLPGSEIISNPNLSQNPGY
tara:strand:- start:279 stop:1823 length:1545 start_codon:yes stop_codon:yes gene_type:complete